MGADLRTPRKAAAGLGSAKSGTGHMIQQRVTAIALAGLVPWFMIAAALQVEHGYASARAFVAQPITAGLLLLLVTAAVLHMRLGLQVVIEDYIAKHATRAVLLILNTFAAAVIWVAAAMSILSVAL
jgi:succinate dehydrogenase / fumarate reductase membrane anchor subunit